MPPDRVVARDAVDDRRHAEQDVPEAWSALDDLDPPPDAGAARRSGTPSPVETPQQRRRIDFMERSCAAGEPNFFPDRAHILSTCSTMSGVLQAVPP